MAYRKFLLVNPSQKSIYEDIGSMSMPHMGLAYIGAVLQKEGHAVRLVDMDYDDFTPEEVGRLVKDEGLEFVGLTATTPLIKNASRVAAEVKNFSPATTVIVGGIHATVVPKEVIRDANIDFVVKSEGEETIKELLDAIEGKKELKSVCGITYKLDGEIIDNPARRLIDNLDEVPFPARDLFEVGQYTYPNMLYKPAAPICTSRGCPAGCTFCQTKNMYGYRVRLRSAESVVEEVELLIKKYKVRQIDVWDDNFILDRRRVFKIRDEIKRRNLKTHFSFVGGIRVDTACDEEVLMALREMGGYNIAFGVESGSQQILDKVQKGITLEQSRRAVSLAKKLGFETWTFFILGFPEETEQTMQKTINFAKELNPDVAHFHVFKPYPGSLIFEEMKRDNLIDSFDYENYGMYAFPVHHTKYVSGATISQYHKKAYREFYLRPKVVFNHLRHLRSLNRLRSNFKTGLGVFNFMFADKQ